MRRRNDQVPAAPFLWTANHRALQAAALLGDEEAAEEIKFMNENLARTVVWVAILAAVVVVAIFGFNTIDTWTTASTRGEVEETRLKYEHQTVVDQRAVEASQVAEKERALLRLRYVEACKVTPAEAELLFPHK